MTKKLHLLLCACMVLTACMSPEEWMAKNQNRPITTGPVEQVLPTNIVEEYVVNEPTTGYDYVIINLRSTSPVREVSIPEVKYNLRTALVLISDDMSQNDLTTGWTLFNGYPSHTRYNSYCNDFEKVLTSQAGLGDYATVHDPWTYDTDDGKARRWAMTSAVWPTRAREINYTRINAIDAKGMMRMGHSFAQHDVSIDPSNLSLEELSRQLETEAKEWKAVTGVGLKVMAEPSGDKQYVEAARMGRQLCMSVCQATATSWLTQQGGATYYSKQQTSDQDERVEHGALSRNLADWAAGTELPDFSHKTHNSLVRTFINGSSDVGRIGEQMTSGEGQLNVFGMHGINRETAVELARLRAMPGLWVASIDEVWEYYYIKKNARVSWQQRGDVTQITVEVPRYANHQFRDLTLNVAVDDASEVTFSSNVVTSGWRQNDGYCTINLGLETRMYKYITEYLNICNRYPSNTCIRRDVEYLLDLLSQGKEKDNYTSLYKQIISTGNSQ